MDPYEEVEAALDRVKETALRIKDERDALAGVLEAIIEEPHAPVQAPLYQAARALLDKIDAQSTD